MSGNIDRIMAQRDMRQLTVAVCGSAPSGEVAQELRQQLVVEAGTIVKLEGKASEGRSPLHAERDEVGFAELKELSKLL